MKKVLVCLCLALSCGCAVVKVSTEDGKTMADITTTGWYLFCLIPLASGNTDAPNEFSTRFFATANLNGNMKVLEKTIDRYHATRADNIVSHKTEEKVLFILLSRSACHTSAQLIYEASSL